MISAIGVSVIIPVYNVEKYLDRCIVSVVGQTYRNIEIILVDDGSTDGSPVVCREYARRDSRIKYIHQDNSGLGAARNTGIKAAASNYVTFLDADDWFEETFVEKVLQAMLHSYSKIGLCDIYYVDSEDMSRTHVKMRFQQFVNSVDSDLSVINKSRLFAWGKIYKKALFTEQNIAYPPFTFEDIITPIIVALAGQVAYVSEPLIHYYRNRQSSLSNNPQNIDDIKKGLALLGERFRKLGRYEQFRLEYKKIALGQLRFACRKWGAIDNKSIMDSLKKLEAYVGDLFPALKDITQKKFYITNVQLAGALDKALPYAMQRTEDALEADYIVNFEGDYFIELFKIKKITIPFIKKTCDQTSFEFDIAELIMERI